jgi:hypothetical protein
MWMLGLKRVVRLYHDAARKNSLDAPVITVFLKELLTEEELRKQEVSFNEMPKTVVLNNQQETRFTPELKRHMFL